MRLYPHICCAYMPHTDANNDIRHFVHTEPSQEWQTLCWVNGYVYSNDIKVWQQLSQSLYRSVCNRRAETLKMFHLRRRDSDFNSTYLLLADRHTSIDTHEQQNSNIHVGRQQHRRVTALYFAFQIIIADKHKAPPQSIKSINGFTHKRVVRQYGWIETSPVTTILLFSFIITCQITAVKYHI